MAHSFRFFASSMTESVWLVDGDEAHHLQKVLRLREGDSVELMDGQGRVGIGVIQDVSAQRVQILPNHFSFSPRAAVPVAVAIGVLKYGDIDELLPMLTELGIDEIHVFGQVGVAKDRLSDKVLIRWRRILRQACKQAKRPWLPEVLVHGDVAGMLAKTKGYSKIILDPGASERLDRVVGRCDGPLLLIVGGEKGFSQGELEHLEASGASRGKIGSYVLRAVTAVYGAAVNLAMYRDGISGKS